MMHERRTRTWRLGLSLMAAALGGCVDHGGFGYVPETVRVALRGGPGTRQVQLADHESAALIAGMRMEKAEEAGRKHADVLLLPRELVEVRLKPAGRDGADELVMHYVHTGAEDQPLVFDCEGFRGLLNGRTVHLDLTDPKAVEWLRKQPRGAIEAVRSIRVNGDCEVDAAALSRLAGRGVVVMIEGDPAPERRGALVEALAAARPAGLMADELTDGEAVVARLPGLTYVGLSGKRIPDPKYLREARFLRFRFDDEPAGSLEPLTRLPKLRALVVHGVQGTADLRALAKLKDLRSLAWFEQEGSRELFKYEGLTDLSPLVGMGRLRFLTLGYCGSLSDLSAIAKLRHLHFVGIAGLPDDLKDLQPLAKLKSLKILVVDDDALKDRQEEFDALREARPDLEIAGFCMGSAWLVAALAAGVLLGLIWRRQGRLAGSTE